MGTLFQWLDKDTILPKATITRLKKAVLSVPGMTDAIVTEEIIDAAINDDLDGFNSCMREARGYGRKSSLIINQYAHEKVTHRVTKKGSDMSDTKTSKLDLKTLMGCVRTISVLKYDGHLNIHSFTTHWKGYFGEPIEGWDEKGISRFEKLRAFNTLEDLLRDMTKEYINFDCEPGYVEIADSLWKEVK